MEEKPVFFCNTCKIKADNEHYRTDWHRHNLRRKVAGLPGISYEAFERRVAATTEVPEDTKKGFSVVCRVCNKSFSNANVYEQHLKSKRHQERQTAHDEGFYRSSTTNSGDDGERHAPPDDPEEHKELRERLHELATELDDARLASLPLLRLQDCLFCPDSFGDLQECLKHMALAHSFFVPNAEALKDLDGLIRYLGEKLAVGRVCLYCGKSFQSLEAVQKHMVDKGHCKMETEDNEEEFEDYYTFDGEWIDEGDWEIVNSTPTNHQQQVGAYLGAKEENLTTYGMEWKLDSGKTIGHRSLRLYYRQKHRPEGADADARVGRLMQQYRDLQATLIPRFSRTERRNQFTAKRRQAYESLRVGVKGNRLQHHFRLQTPV